MNPLPLGDRPMRWAVLVQSTIRGDYKATVIVGPFRSRERAEAAARRHYGEVVPILDGTVKREAVGRELSAQR